MKLYVIRHGESEMNFQKRYSGWLDTPLTEKGRQDAQKARKILDGITFDKIYASDLQRAIHTAKIAVPGWEPTVSPILREINVGNTVGELIADYSPEQRKYFYDIGYDEVGGESRIVFKERLREFMSEVESLDCQTIAAFAHGGCLRSITEIILGVPFPRGRVRCNNCTVAEYEYINEKWYLNSWINP